MPPGDGVTSGKDLRLHRAGYVHQVNAASRRAQWRRRRRLLHLGTLPSVKDSLHQREHLLRMEIADHHEHGIRRRIKLPINADEVLAAIRSHLFLARGHLRVRVPAEKDFPQALSRQEVGLGPLESHAFEHLPPLALEFSFGKRRLARKFAHERQQRLRELGQPVKRDGGRVRTRAGGEISAKAPQVLFDFPARPPACAGPNDRRGDFGKTCRALRDVRVARAQKKPPRKFRYRMLLRQDDFHSVGEPGTSALGPLDAAFRGQGRHATERLRSRSGRHHAAASLLPRAGWRKMTARFSRRR